MVPDPQAGLSRGRGRGRIPALAVALLFLVLALLRSRAPEVYARAIQLAGVAPFRFPFLDADMVLSALRCRARGVDVYAADPCDALGRVYDYSPAWLALGRIGGAAVPPAVAGPAIDLAFASSLLLLPAARSRRDAVLVAAGVLSTATLFAMERANTDLVILALALCAAALATRGPVFRAAGYALCFAAGLLKYYPMALMLLAIRERWRAFAAVAAVAALGLAAFVAAEGRELSRALALIPVGSWFRDMFGASDLPMGLASLSGGAIPPRAGRAAEAALDLGAIAAAARIATALRPALAGLGCAERSGLMAGALLVVGCFFTAQNIGYRAVVLIPALPALAVLRAAGMGTGAGAGSGARLRRAGPALALLVLWSIGWRYWLLEAGKLPVIPRAAARDANLAGWLAMQVAWWAVAVLLLGCVFGVVLERVASRMAEADGNRTHRSLAASP